MTLQQQALQAVQVLPDEKLPVLIEFAHFLNQANSIDQISAGQTPVLSGRRALLGILKDQIHMSDDFNETPDIFKEYM